MPTWFVPEGNDWLFVDDGRQCGLPGVACDVCEDTWAVSGCNYPTIRCSDVPLTASASMWPVAPGRYRELLEEVQRHVRDGRPLFPGTSFGQPTAPVKRAPPSVFRHDSSLFLGPEVALDPAVVSLGLVTMRFTAKNRRGTQSFELYEVEAWPVATRPPAVLRARRKAEPMKKPCAVCGYPSGLSYEGEPLLASSLAGRHIARLDDAPGTVFVSGELKAALERHKVAPTLSFKPVKLV